MDATTDQPAADYRAEDAARALRGAGWGEVEVLDTVASTNAWLAERIAAAAWDQTGGGASHGATLAESSPRRAAPRDSAPCAPAPGDAAPAGSAPRAVVAGFQAGGRGRLNRQWVTPPGTAVTFSVACVPVDHAGRAWSPELVPWLTLLMAHAVTGAVRDLTGAPATIKWPNDVLVHDRKLCGILATMVPAAATGGAGASSAPTVVVGAGINVAQTELPVPTATSLRLETAADTSSGDAAVPNRPAVLTAVLERLADLVSRVGEDPARELGPHGSVRTEIEARLDTIGRRVAVQLPGTDQPAVGTAVGLGAAGQLVVRGQDGALREFSAGDVVHVRPAVGQAARA
ncbi:MULTISPECIES: biotin--[acetyl-CoA-carboxylase] ligase [Kocuria]|uniref:biotin--[acetyl-CoA-carboxylase] ligase n=1 Tax=Kocuria TaxID=57493 RepID=UPI0011A237D9|nr:MULTISPECIES: biotin--[acetyl-CoA-carboxylase] ligase [Kocuria]